MDILSLIGRDKQLFEADVLRHDSQLRSIVSSSRFLVLGGAGSIGQAVTKEIFKRNPRKLSVVDISENNMVELVRDIRSSYGDIDGDFKTYALDIGSPEYDAFIHADGDYDYVLNLSALKHVRSEKDPFTLMRMVNVNILNTEKSLLPSKQSGVKKYFCVSTDKAANPVNMMGASKRIMEMFLMRRSLDLPLSTARFANVAFSELCCVCCDYAQGCTITAKSANNVAPRCTKGQAPRWSQIKSHYHIKEFFYIMVHSESQSASDDQRRMARVA